MTKFGYIFANVSTFWCTFYRPILCGGVSKLTNMGYEYIIRKQCFKMKWRTLSWEYVKSGGKFHHRRKLCQVLTPPPTARKLNFPPWQFLSCSLPPPRAHICHEYHELYSWRKNCHVEKFQLSMYDNCGKIENFSTCGEISVQLMGFYCSLC